MRRGPRGGPGEASPRLARAERLLGDSPGAAAGPLAMLAAVLRHQQSRLGSAAGVFPPSGPGRFPLLDLAPGARLVADEVRHAVSALSGAVPGPLAEAGAHLKTLTPAAAETFVETWLDDIGLVEPRLGFWAAVAAGPLLEAAAATLSPPDDWRGAACPVCGGPPQASVIAEESGEFMAGSPRSLVCGRCASWWNFARVTCPGCNEEDPKQIESFLAEGRPWARVDTCATCRHYIKTFDLREPGAVAVIPLVDDVATLTLDVWAREQGFSRSPLSMAGV